MYLSLFEADKTEKKKGKVERTIMLVTDRMDGGSGQEVNQILESLMPASLMVMAHRKVGSKRVQPCCYTLH